MVRNVQATTTNGLRKNRVTQKTRLRVVRGQLDAEAIVLEDGEERNRVLASQGVDAEDANEHHLQAALSASHRKQAGESHTKQSESHIPTPDAAGVVEAYESLYPPGKYKQSITHLRFSETVEESIEDGLAGGFAYFLDERDAEWIQKNNQEARGEGTSASASASANGAMEDTSVTSTRNGRASHSRSAKARGKEPEQHCTTNHAYTSIVVDEDEFELVMGLFEKLTEEKFPFIHLDLDAFPPFFDYECVFAAPLPPATFANYIIPSSVPSPERLVLVAKAVYSHWKERKVEREGKRIVPQLDYDESQESSYVCFRRRDAKPIRRTRASSTAYTDKLVRLRSELQMGFDLARMVLEREGLKAEEAVVAREVWQARCALVEGWKSQDARTPGMVIEEGLLYDRERVVKKPKVEGLGRVVLGPNRRPSAPQSGSGTPATDSHSPLTAHLELPGVNLSTLSPLAYVGVQSAVHQRYMTLQAGVEKEMTRLRARDSAWDDLVDMPFQATPISHPDKLFTQYRASSLPSSPCAPPSIGVNPTTTLVNGDAQIFRPEAMHLPSLSTTTPVSSTSSLPPLLPPDLGKNQPVESFGTPSGFSVHSVSERVPRSLRLRTGRGGRLHLDRRLDVRHPNSLLRMERAKWPQHGRSASPRRGEEYENREGVRWQARDWPPERQSAASQSKGVNEVAEHALGKDYWAHESIYTDRSTVIGKRKRREDEEESIGFEQSGYGLGLATFAEWGNGSADDSQWKPEPPSRRDKYPDNEENAQWHMQAPTDDEVERAWRIEERWRYDSDVGQDGDYRFLLDDFQPKFLRTAVTLLDASDHETIKTDPKHLATPLIPNSGPKPFPLSNRLTEQERVRLLSLRASRTTQSFRQPQLESQPQLPSIPQLLPRPAPSTTPPLPPPLPQHAPPAVSSTERMGEQIRQMGRQPQPLPQSQSQPPSESPTAPIVAVTPQPGQRVAITQQSPPTPTPPQPNGFHLRQTPLANGFSGDDRATVRVSSIMRSKVQTPNTQQHGTLGLTVNGFTNSNTNSAFITQNQNSVASHPGLAHGLNPQQYAALRSVFGAQQQQQARPQAPMHMNSVPGSGNVNLQMGPANLNLKLPTSRATQLRMNGHVVGDANGVGGSPVLVHASPPRPNANRSPVPHVRTPSANAHLMTPSHDHASPPNVHALGRASPLGHPTLSSSPQHHSSLVPLPLHTTNLSPRTTQPLMHQQMVGAAGQGHEYS